MRKQWLAGVRLAEGGVLHMLEPAQEWYPPGNVAVQYTKAYTLCKKSVRGAEVVAVGVPGPGVCRSCRKVYGR